MGVKPVLPEIDTLPNPEIDPTVAHGQGERAASENAAHVRGHVISPLLVVAEQGVAVANQPGEEGLEVGKHLGIGVFANNQGSAGVMEEKM